MGRFRTIISLALCACLSWLTLAPLAGLHAHGDPLRADGWIHAHDLDDHHHASAHREARRGFATGESRSLSPGLILERLLARTTGPDANCADRRLSDSPTACACPCDVTSQNLRPPIGPGSFRPPSDNRPPTPANLRSAAPRAPPARR